MRPKSTTLRQSKNFTRRALWRANPIPAGHAKNLPAIGGPPAELQNSARQKIINTKSIKENELAKQKYPRREKNREPYPPALPLLASIDWPAGYYTNSIATPIFASLSRFSRSILTTFPLLIRAKEPFTLASVSVRGKLTSTTCPILIGVVIGTITNVPVLLIFELLPLKNLFASGSQTLTGHESSVRLSLRCSIKVSISKSPLPSF
jgi:hypothetical protein